jgi:type VI secretion system protein ImpL
VPLDEYTEQLKFVRDALQARLDDPDQQDKLESKVKSARSKTKSILGAARDTGWAPTLEKLLYPPLDLVWKRMDEDFAGTITNKWCNEVVTAFERNIATAYPFNPSGHDIAMADFEAFFHPENGDLWKYYDSVLKSHIPLRGTRYELAETGESTLGRYRGSVVSFLNASHEVSSVMFPRGGEDAAMEFDVQILGAPEIKEISIRVDGETVRYRNGPEVWGTLKWPGEGSPGARIEALGFGKEANLEREGEWGLFRLLEQGTVKAQPGERVFAVQWDFRETRVGLITMRFRPKRADTPFFGIGGRKRFMTIFRTKNLIVPRSIVTRAEACRVGSSKK